MYLTRQLRLLAEVDPTIIDRERAAAADHQRRERLLDALDRAVEWVATLERRRMAGQTVRAKLAANAADRVAFYTAAAARAGLIHPRKDLAQ